MALSVSWIGAASAQIEYLSRNSLVAYEETEVDLLTNAEVFRSEDGAGTQTTDVFGVFVGMPGQTNQFDDTGSGQFSELFANAIEFDTRVYAEENTTGGSLGRYTAAAISTFDVSFRVADDTLFSLTGSRFDASAGNRLGTTNFSMTGPGVSINQSSGIIDDGGTLLGGETYTIAAVVESIGVFVEDFVSTSRTRGEDLGFDFLLLLEPIVTGIVGDYDQSGQVEQGDLNLVLNNWGQARVFDDPVGGPFATPDIDQEELNRVLNNWGGGEAPSFAGFAVPEPALGAALLGAVVLIKRKKPTD
ncbi:MAG: hypothetical protein AAF663_04435 [Planctomycetota bacterium]